MSGKRLSYGRNRVQKDGENITSEIGFIQRGCPGVENNEHSTYVFA